MVDPLHIEPRDKPIPGPAFIGMDDRLGSDVLADCRCGVAFLILNPGNRFAAALAKDDHNLSAGSREAPVLAIGLAIFLLLLAAEIGPVNLNRFVGSADLSGFQLRANGLAQLVSQDESRLVLAIQIAAELKALCPFAPFTKMAIASR